MAKVGRPTKRTPELEERVIRATRAGFGIVTTAEFAGVSKSTLQRWMDDDESFRARVYCARADVKVEVAESLVVQARNGNDRAAFRWLAARCPEFQDTRNINVRSDTETAASIRQAAAAMEGSVADQPEEPDQ